MRIPREAFTFAVAWMRACDNEDHEAKTDLMLTIGNMSPFHVLDAMTALLFGVLDMTGMRKKYLDFVGMHLDEYADDLEGKGRRRRS